MPLAFWVDSATYLASATMLTTIIVQRGPDGGHEQARRPSSASE